MDLKQYEFWFIVGSQDLYGEETLRAVGEHAALMAEDFAKDPLLPGSVVLKQTATSPAVIRRLFEEAAGAPRCAGIMTWMHTFSPSKMWIQGLGLNKKPILHLHTQFNRDIPWAAIDMDFMNLNQSAHGDREHGHIFARMRVPRKVVAGFWQDTEVRRRMGVWMRAAAAFQDGTLHPVVRIGDNMREVAVTEGDKVEAQRTFGWQINTWGVGDLAACYKEVDDGAARDLVRDYEEVYDAAVPEGSRKAVAEQAKLEIALRRLLASEDARAFTTTFQDLHGLPQLPALAVQSLMSQGYGFGAEGDWKQAMLTRAAKVMASGLPGGVSFIEDYTYHLEPGNEAVLGAHMVEVCPSIAETGKKPRVEVHPLAIGGKAPPARLVFNAAPGPAVLATVIDLGDRFRMIVNEVEGLPIERDMPALPVARALWKPYPSLTKAAERWIIAGGTHHSVYAPALTYEFFRDWADMARIECVRIGNPAVD
jgi:L-arabinose isomerase